MTMSPGELDRKVRQLDHDVMSIYELLHGISAQQGRLLTRLEGLDAAIGTRLDAHDARLDRIDGRLGAHDTRFDLIDSQLAEILCLLRAR
jgi:predicted nucleic acid-binding protein